MADEDARVYVPCLSARLSQGEILSNVIERQAVRQPDATFLLHEVIHPFALVVSQDCDLEQDARARTDPLMTGNKENKLLHHVLLAVASEFTKAGDKFPGADIRKLARQNKAERFHFLAPVPAADDAPGSGIPALVVDFKRLFSYPTLELLASIAAGETSRRARLAPTYLEHLSSRTGYFIQRVALPKDHHDLDTSATPTPAERRVER